MAVEEVKARKLPIVPIIIMSAIISFFGPMWQLLISTFPYWIVNSLGEAVCNMGLTVVPFIVLLLAGLASRIGPLKGRLNATNMAYIYMATLPVSYTILYPWALGTSYIWASRYTEEALSAQIVPWFMAPPASVCRVMATGGLIDWGAWIVPIGWWWTMTFAHGLFFLALATVMRRQWIDVEQVPFPQTLIVRELVQNITPSLSEAVSKRKWFLIGLLLGLAFQLPITLTGVFPWFPDIYGVKVNSCPFLSHYVVAGDPLAAIPGMMSYNYNPAVVAIAYQAPMAVLFSTWVFALFYIIAVQVAYVMGYYTGIEGEGGCGRYWCHPSPQTDPPLKFMAIAGGGLLALSIMNLALNRKYLGDTLHAAVRKEGMAEQEKGEAFSYRTSYTLLFASFIFVVIFWMASSLTLLDALILPVSAFLLWYGQTRMYGLAGVYWVSSDKGLMLFRIVHPTPDTPVTTQQYIDYKFATTSGCNFATEGWGGAIFSSFAGYKMGNSFGIHPRNTFKVVLMALIIAPLFSLLGFIIFTYGVGGTRIGVWKNWYEGIGERYENYPSWWTSLPASEPWIPYMLLGMVWIAILSVLHARFVWFPLEPIGWLIGTTAASALFGLWTPFLVAWILKMLTFRLGGAKLFENRGSPIASGAVTGCVIGMAFGGVLFIIKFFVPY